MSVVTITIRSPKTVINDGYVVIGLDIVYEVNRIPYAQIRLHDGNVATREFPISDAQDFEPGKKIEIDVRYEGEDTYTLFKGIVVGHSIEASSSASELVIDLKSTAIGMTLGRKSAVYSKQTDDKIISKLIEQNKISKGNIASTKSEHMTLVQYNATDWDFMIARAEANGLLVTIADEKISADEINLTGAASHTFEYGIDQIYEIDLKADARYQIKSVESVGWDTSQQKLTSPAKGKELELQQGNLDAVDIAKKLGAQPITLNNALPPAKSELQAWSDAALARSRLSFIRGRISLPGKGKIQLLDLIELKGGSKRFSGKMLVTGIRHRIDFEGWTTDVQVGLSSEPFARQPDILDMPASGLLPAVSGMQIGVVAAFEEDPDKLLRVKVVLPSIDQEKGVVWARLAMPYAGKERGYFFWPEVGDEVVIGFFNDDPRQAVILGSLYSGKNTLPKAISAPDKDNNLKSIVTRSGITIQIDDKKKAVEIKTPGKNTIILDDDGKKIEIKDQHGNQFTLSKDGITLKSAKDFIVDASGDIKIKGAKVDVNA